MKCKNFWFRLRKLFQTLNVDNVYILRKLNFRIIRGKHRIITNSNDCVLFRMLELIMESGLLQKLGRKTITKQDLFQKVEQSFDLVPEVLKGTSSSKATIRYGCSKVLMDLSEKYPEKLYSYM